MNAQKQLFPKSKCANLNGTLSSTTNFLFKLIITSYTRKAHPILLGSFESDKSEQLHQQDIAIVKTASFDILNVFLNFRLVSRDGILWVDEEVGARLCDLGRLTHLCLWSWTRVPRESVRYV